ncbi:transporter substrate-binding domain-containing protein [Microbacterium foliorum]|uniref:transporter substrate-binding domain-containing protein n=1 Tax=Microbacterium foliorum TaxID=104336 RepID=UPI0012947985|nr:transporter substrate-binding domain-containing protein [Microbacterium foliorum]
MSIKRRSSASAIGGIVAGAMMLVGCAGIPADVDGTLRAAQGGDLRVGITHNPPWTDTTDPDKLSGEDVRLVEKFAESIDATVVWTVGSEAILTDQLHTGSLDPVIGGFTDDTPRTDNASTPHPRTASRSAPVTPKQEWHATAADLHAKARDTEQVSRAGVGFNTAPLAAMRRKSLP